jgi:signal peptidase I
MTNKTKKFLEEVKSLAFVVLLAFLIRTLCFEPFYIPSSSMEPTLLPGDYIFSTKYDYGYSKYSLSPFSFNIFDGRVLAHEPKPGDIVIFRPPHDMSVRYIKRLIGLPGDKIQINQGRLYINGKEVQRKYVGDYDYIKGIKCQKYLETLPNGVSYTIMQFNEYTANDFTKVFEVPAGHYFFMGDNRDDSKDSRFDLGYVPAENLISKAKIIHFSTGSELWISGQSISDGFKQIWVWLSSIRFSRMLRSVYN